LNVALETLETDDDDKTVQSKGSGTKNRGTMSEFLIKVTIRPKHRRIRLTQSEVLNIHHGICTALINVPGNITLIDNVKEEHTTADGGIDEKDEPAI
jgi:hypothetical protein